MSGDGGVLALDTPTLLRLLQVPTSTLNYWVGKGFCHPTLDTGSGKRATRYWTVEDLLVLRSVKALRAAGCSLQLLTVVEERLRTRMGVGLANAVLYYDGKDVLVEDGGVVMSLIQQAGQGVFADTVQLVAFPLQPWFDEGERSAKPVNIDEIRDRRAAAKSRRVSA